LHSAKSELQSNNTTIDALVGWMLREISLKTETAEFLISKSKSFSSERKLTAVNVFDEIERNHETSSK